jgi:hypothetical protein
LSNSFGKNRIKTAQKAPVIAQPEKLEALVNAEGAPKPQNGVKTAKSVNQSLESSKSTDFEHFCKVTYLSF